MPYLFYIGFLEITWIDIIDITLVSFLLYQLYKLLKGSVAAKILSGVLLIYAFYLIVNAIGLQLLSSILGQFISVGVIATLILFQQEIRRFLLLIGRSTSPSILRPFSWRKNAAYDDEQQIAYINAAIEASKVLASTNTGALIVFSKSAELRFYAESGDELDAVVSKRLLIAIFNKKSPLHDGAVIVSPTGRIKAARCLLPVSESDQLSASLGTRHRAAIGITEVSDAIVLIVSEETGQVAIARNGELYQNLSPQKLRTKLNKYLLNGEAHLTTE